MRRLSSVSRLCILTVLFLLLVSCDFKAHSENVDARQIAPLGKPPAKEIWWSPIDTNKILVSAGYIGYSENVVYMLDTVTGDKQTITHTDSGDLTIRSWSPDGNKFILSAEPNTKGFEQGALWIVDVNDGSKTFFQSNDMILVWGPTQNQFTFSRTNKLNSEKEYTEVIVLDLTSGEETKIYAVDRSFLVFGLSWSPSREQLALSMSRIGHDDANIYILNVNSGQLRQITKDGNSIYPVWSPTRDLIVYDKKTYNRDDALYSLQLIDPSGFCDIRLIAADYLLSPTWSPNGDLLAFIEPNADGIFTVNIQEFLDKNFLSQRCN